MLIFLFFFNFISISLFYLYQIDSVLSKDILHLIVLEQIKQTNKAVLKIKSKLEQKNF